MTSPHASSCALHNAPASEPGPCDCGATDILERIETASKEIASFLKGERTPPLSPAKVNHLLAECAITIKALRAQVDRVAK